MTTYEYLHESEAECVYQLITAVFLDHVAPTCSAQGVAWFFNQVTSSRVTELSKGKDSFVLVAREDGKITGMLAIRNANHISLIFVDSLFQGTGIGRRLVEEAIRICKERNPGINEITVNASPNAETFYERIGFEATDEERSDHGLRFKPMEKRLDSMSESDAGSAPAC